METRRGRGEREASGTFDLKETAPQCQVRVVGALLRGQENAVGVPWAGGGWLGRIREGCRRKADFEGCVGLEYAQMHREAFLAEETTQAKVRRQELAVRVQEAELGGR